MTPKQRKREVRRQIRQSIIQEKITANAVAKHLRSLASSVAQNPKRLQALSSASQANLAKILRLRLRVIATLSGNDNLANIERLLPGKSIAFGFNAKDAQGTFEQAVSAWLREHAASRAKDITDSFRDWLRDLLAEAVEEGLGEKEIARRIRDKAKDVSRWRAERIARTETHSASERAKWEAAKASNIDLVKEWADSDDGRVRPSHSIADGKVIKDIEKPFSVGDSDLQYPGDPDGEAKEIINCRCIAFYHPIIDGEILR